LNLSFRSGALAATAVAAVAAIPFAAATASEPAQPATPEQIVAYHDSGEWDQDIATTTAAATKSLKSQLVKKPRKPAIVIDIDDTLESSYECMKRSNFERSSSALCVLNFDQTPIAPTWKLLKLAQKSKVAVYLITGRPDGLRDGTIKQLKEDGLKGRYVLVTRQNDQLGQPAAPYKTAARKAIERKGLKILVNIGDQKSDLSGGFSVKRFKLPNPMYFTP
jgi:predicted secreted acid phosphatase